MRSGGYKGYRDQIEGLGHVCSQECSSMLTGKEGYEQVCGWLWYGKNTSILSLMYESRYQLGTGWRCDGWRGLQESGIKWLSRGREKHILENILRQYHCLSAHLKFVIMNFKVRQVTYLGIFLPKTPNLQM